jgi:hypothetical protein
MHVVWAAWQLVYPELYLPLLQAAVAHIVTHGHPKLDAAVPRALPAALLSASDRLAMLMRPSPALPTWSVEQAAVERLYLTHTQQMMLLQTIGAMDMILDTYDAHHNRADYRTYISRMPLHAALYAVFARPNCVRWLLLGLQRLDYFFKNRLDVLRALAKSCQRVNDVFTETANTQCGERSDPRTPIGDVMRTMQRNTCLADIERELTSALGAERGGKEEGLDRSVTRNAHALTEAQRGAVADTATFLRQHFAALGAGTAGMGAPADPFAAGLAALVSREPGGWVAKTEGWLRDHLQTHTGWDAGAMSEALSALDHVQQAAAAVPPGVPQPGAPPGAQQPLVPPSAYQAAQQAALAEALAAEAQHP